MNGAWQTAFVVYGIAAVISMVTAGVIWVIVKVLGMSSKPRAGKQ